MRVFESSLEEVHHLDRQIREILAAGNWSGPPVDVLALARRLGMSIAIDNRQEPRGRHMRVEGRTAIFVRPEPRPERLQWTVAHEMGEALAHRLLPIAEEVSPAEREEQANRFAARLLLPSVWFERDARESQNELLELKRFYSTASHELIAWRLLDLSELAVATVIDQGKLTRRRSNLVGRVPPWTAVERSCLAEAQATGRRAERNDREFHVTAWPVHEPGWRREIVRLAWRAESEWE